MKKICIYLMLLVGSKSFAQINLVSNWSFEDTVACPNNYNELNRAVGWSSFRQSPDYFNSCNSSFVGVPSNDEGFQYPKSGNAYAGFITSAMFATNSREIIGSQLIQSLIIGQKYFVSFYVSLAYGSIQQTKMATNKIGIRFSTILYSNSNPIPIDNFAQIYTDSIISDTSNWIKISGAFIADSTYQYLSIGNFFTDSATSRIVFSPSAAFAYYFVDDIRISTDSNFVNSIGEYDLGNLLTVFPNPCRDWIEVFGDDIYELSLYNILGNRVLYREVKFTSLVKINISDLSDGMYFLVVQSIKIKFTRKIIVQ